jgi:hypothetical protein
MMAAKVMREEKAYQVIGTRPIRPDGTDKVTGRALYGADVRLSGMLYGAVLRSPHAHARIKSIDTSKALALDGVAAVCTYKDCSAFSDKILYWGQEVAAIAAVDEAIASQAIELIDVEYEVLPFVLDPEELLEEFRHGYPGLVPAEELAQAVVGVVEVMVEVLEHQGHQVLRVQPLGRLLGQPLEPAEGALHPHLQLPWCPLEPGAA